MYILATVFVSGGRFAGILSLDEIPGSQEGLLGPQVAGRDASAPLKPSASISHNKGRRGGLSNSHHE